MRISPSSTTVLGFAPMLITASHVVASDALGHRVACEIAFQELNDQAPKEVTQFIGMGEQFKIFAEACTWPENPKKRSTEHHINVPRDFQTFTPNACPDGVEVSLSVLILRRTSKDARMFGHGRSRDRLNLHLLRPQRRGDPAGALVRRPRGEMRGAFIRAVPRQEPEPRPVTTENGRYVIYAPLR